MDVYTNNRQVSAAASATPTQIVRPADNNRTQNNRQSQPAANSSAPSLSQIVPTQRSLEVAQTALTGDVPVRGYQAPSGGLLREEEISDQMLERAFADANKAIPNNSFSLSYGVHEATNRITVGIYSSDTGELIRELPPESRLDTYARISEFVGLLFDGNA
ncbi:MAG: flagellar protein FlaG [Defluviitaleaceae bacterium]|nr:flagellar protein FlaG [Defluviitaleaceae bacterium]